MTRTLLTGARVFTGERILTDRAVLLDGGDIVDLPHRDAPPADARVIELPATTLLAPGFVDAQVNGAGGVLFNDTPTTEAALAIATAMRPFGTTGSLPTFITDGRDGMRAAAEAAIAAVATPGSGVLGVHLEGPFISSKRRGGHDPASIRRPDAADEDMLVDLARRLAAVGGRMLLTLAPEEVEDATIARLAAAGIVVSAGHTAASYERIATAVDHGLTGFTHLGNAMPPIVNRDPGPVVAGLDAATAWCGVIVDGIHVHPALLRVMHAAKRQGRLFVVTDAMPPTGTTLDGFRLYGETILRRDGRLTTADGTLAGADVDMATSLRNLLRFLPVSLEEALAMVSLAPAAFLRLDHRLGRIAPGHAADLVLLDEAQHVLLTIVGGRSFPGEAGGEPLLRLPPTPAAPAVPAETRPSR